MTLTKAFLDEMKCAFDFEIIHQAYLAGAVATGVLKEDLGH